MSVAFMFFMIIVLFPIRKLGWAISGMFYSVNVVASVVLLSVWGGAVAFLIGTLDYNFHPNIIVKLIFGFLEGMYLASLSYGMFKEDTIPEDYRERHNLVSHYPQVVFSVIVVIMFFANAAYLNSNPVE